MTHTLDVYAALWHGLQTPMAIIVATVIVWWGYQISERRIDEGGETPWQPQHAVRRITDADKRAEADRIERDVYANPWPARLTPLDHDAIRDMPLVAPRVYRGRAEVVFPDAVVADVVPADWVHYLYDAASWQLEMRRGPTEEEPTGALVLAGAS